MRELSLEEIKEIQLEILKKVTDFCDENNLTYFLCGGTLLGAVRHKGYIPWDDDIDLMMPRPDYERFKTIFKIDNLRLGDFYKDRDFIWPFVKVSKNNTNISFYGKELKNVGVNIDIFPIDGFPTTKKEIHKHLSRISLLRTIYWSETDSPMSTNKLKSIILKVLAKIYMFYKGNTELLTAIDLVGKRYSFAESENAGIAVWGYGENEICPKSIYMEKIQLPFEGMSFFAMKDYDIYLKTVYGDYMTLPPEDKRFNHSEAKFYINDK